MFRIPNPAYEIEADDLPEYIELNTKVIVCPNCNGKGKSSNYLGAFTQSDMDEMGDDFKYDYMRGEYDKECENCQGRNVVDEVDIDNNTPQNLRLYYKYLEAEAYDAYVYRMENRENPYGP